MECKRGMKLSGEGGENLEKNTGEPNTSIPRQFSLVQGHGLGLSSARESLYDLRSLELCTWQRGRAGLQHQGCLHLSEIVLLAGSILFAACLLKKYITSACYTGYFICQLYLKSIISPVRQITFDKNYF